MMKQIYQFKDNPSSVALTFFIVCDDNSGREFFNEERTRFVKDVVEDDLDGYKRIYNNEDND